MSASPSYRHALLLVAATACWGCGTVLSKQVLDRGVAPLTLLVVELAASSLLLLVATLLLDVLPDRSPAMVRLAALGILNPGLAYALGLLGLVSITASMSVLLWATEPILIMLLAVLVLRERIALATVTAVAIAMVGVMLVIYRPGASGDAVGVTLTVAAVAACALYAVLTRRLLLDDSSLAVVLAQQLAALCFAVVLGGGASAVGAADLGLPDDLATWALAIASGVVYYGFAFWFFVGGLRGVPASIAGSFLPLIPVFGLAAAYVLGDRFLDRQWLGAGLVVLAAAAAAIRHLSAPASPRRPAG
jgi:probable blue pigment (indigoidine) exporter